MHSTIMLVQDDKTGIKFNESVDLRPSPFNALALASGVVWRGVEAWCCGVVLWRGGVARYGVVWCGVV